MAAEDLVSPSNEPSPENDNAGGASDSDVRSTSQMLKTNPPPQSLPPGWFLKPGHSAPGNYYYFNQDTGECRWDVPVAGQRSAAASAGATSVAVSQESLNATAAAAAAAVKSILKRSNGATTTGDGARESVPPSASPSSRKRVKTSSGSLGEKEHRKDKDRNSSRDKHHRDRHHHERERHHHGGGGSGRSGETKEVRVLHILKKHRGSRKPASWRNAKITDSKEKAIADLRELISILNESGGDHKELRATFEELAKTESDCSSAKRGGDLGFFGRKKMQPAFEKASFGLRAGQLSDIVDTSSGVHVILRLA